MSFIFKVFFISVFILCYLNMNLFASAQESESEVSSIINFISHSQDKLILVYNYAPKFEESNYSRVTLAKGYYQIIVSPMYSLDTYKNSQDCSDLSLNSNPNIKIYFFDQIIKFKSSQFNLSQGILSEKACLDLNEDKKPELIVWGNESDSTERYPLILSSEPDNEAFKGLQYTPFSLLNNPIHEIKLRPILKNGWLQLILLDTSKSQEYKKIGVRPMSFNTESREYSPDKFIFNENTEIAFSTEQKKLAYDEFNTSFVVDDSLVLNRSGDILGYQHGEGAANSGNVETFLATFDIKSKKFRHLNLFKNPGFQKTVNQKYPGFLSRAKQNHFDGADPISVKVIGFQKRDLLFKVSAYDMGANQNNHKNIFCGYWKYNVDTGNIALVSWNPSAAINVEHTGYVPEILTD